MSSKQLKKPTERLGYHLVPNRQTTDTPVESKSTQAQHRHSVHRQIAPEVPRAHDGSATSWLRTMTPSTLRSRQPQYHQFARPFRDRKKVSRLTQEVSCDRNPHRKFRVPYRTLVANSPNLVVPTRVAPAKSRQCLDFCLTRFTLSRFLSTRGATKTTYGGYTADSESRYDGVSAIDGISTQKSCAIATSPR